MANVDDAEAIGLGVDGDVGAGLHVAVSAAAKTNGKCLLRMLRVTFRSEPCRFIS